MTNTITNPYYFPQNYVRVGKTEQQSKYPEIQNHSVWRTSALPLNRITCRQWCSFMLHFLLWFSYLILERDHSLKKSATLICDVAACGQWRLLDRFHVIHICDLITWLCWGSLRVTWYSNSVVMTHWTTTTKTHRHKNSSSDRRSSTSYSPSYCLYSRYCSGCFSLGHSCSERFSLPSGYNWWPTKTATSPTVLTTVETQTGQVTTLLEVAP